MSELIERKVYVRGEEVTVKLKPRSVAAQRVSREQKVKAREETRRRQSAEPDQSQPPGPKP